MKGKNLRRFPKKDTNCEVTLSGTLSSVLLSVISFARLSNEVTKLVAEQMEGDEKRFFYDTFFLNFCSMGIH